MEPPPLWTVPASPMCLIPWTCAVAICLQILHLVDNGLLQVRHQVSLACIRYTLKEM